MREGSETGKSVENTSKVTRQNSGFIDPLHSLSKQNYPNKCIDKSFEQWNRFENFLQFASKKEVRDRLKEFDAPNLDKYIDPDTVDKIAAARKPPPRPSKSKGPKHEDKGVQEEHRARIQKMRELYGLFMKMEAEGSRDSKEDQPRDIMSGGSDQ
mmetsp:Transcript_6141/g.9863  ORF Transcript_6141/g.9863 Transcript_6141/m.9863 type:complete len:155 (+) Transcript_6141:1039-1503(+)|eukprot:CAMPEP_0170506536 /NCGR_PEP_ID=MMETSP0208-20121228/55241_1 /TAXON_ID=197538 /ORGANISM="Strombidium inclinatum, Strain S3" /LENGTH=154 /DNA_ID=CAMNT_0010788115 /DNA_START=959 /DNA_END=1423 /DNA_ORIENTATION=+